MTLTGEYERRAKKSYKTHEGKALLAHVRLAIAQIELLMAQGQSEQRGKNMAQIVNELEMAADLFDLHGEKRRAKGETA